VGSIDPYRPPLAAVSFIAASHTGRYQPIAIHHAMTAAPVRASPTRRRPPLDSAPLSTPTRRDRHHISRVGGEPRSCCSRSSVGARLVGGRGRVRLRLLPGHR
jgi:hypothetical protein